MRRQTQVGAISIAFLAALTVGVITLVLLLNARTIMTLTMTNRYELSEKARLNAESAIALAKAHLAEDRNYGKNGETIIVGKKPEDSDEQGEWAEVTFARDAEFGSLNNLGEQNKEFGKGGVILDPGMCQIVAVSHCRNKRVVAYEVVTGPPLPFSLGSSGALTVSGKSLIGAVESSAVMADEGITDPEIVEGGAVSNGADRARSIGDTTVSASLTLSPDTRVVGDVQAAGSVEQNGAKVERGVVREHQDPEQLPEIDVASYDPYGKPGVVPHTEAKGVGGPVFGFHRYGPPKGADPAGYTVTFPDAVDLQGTLIFVNGDVVLEKPLTGTGALVATGKVTLKGGANMKADSLAAVVAGKDLTVAGTNREESKFVGLLYTEGNLALSHTQVVGSFIAAGEGQAGEGSIMSIVDSDVFTSPQGEDVAIAIQDFANPAPPGRIGDSEETAAIIRPNPADFIVNGKVKVDPTFLRALIKIRVGKVTYDSLESLPKGAPENLRTAFKRTLDLVLAQAVELEKQQRNKLVEIVRFDLNEFLNISDRLRSSRTYYIES